MVTGADKFGREPVQYVEIEQPRCSNRFGVAPCEADTADGPKCYQTWGTCLDRVHINQSGNIKWLFGKASIAMGEIGDAPADLFLTYSRDGDLIRSNPIPSLVSVSQSSSRLNVGASRDGESPFGLRSSVTVQFRDIPWDDRVGDFYRADRTAIGGDFWQKWVVRNAFYPKMYIRVYEGYRGQTLDEMQSRLYVFDNISGPDAMGNVTVTGVDPLRLADGKKSKFPRVTDMRLVNAINNSQTTGIILTATVADISDAFGNTGGTRFVRIGSEVISYTGYTSSGEDRTLTGVTRARFGTVAGTADANSNGQRVGRYNDLSCWATLKDLLLEHTDLPANFINYAQWEAEANIYLVGLNVTSTIPEPTAVEQLAGELMQQCSFYIWWDERKQTIPMKAVRPERTYGVLTDDANIIAGSANLRRDVDAWFTQLYVHYDVIDPTKGNDPTNFRFTRGLIDGAIELPAAADTVRQKEIFSRWIQTDAQAFDLIVRLLGRFNRIPRYLDFAIDAKDRGISTGDIYTVVSKVSVTTEGQPKEELWQVISVDEVESGHASRLELQEFQFLGKRFAFYMADDAPDFDEATDEEKFAGGWYSDDNGEMPDGSEPYLYQ